MVGARGGHEVIEGDWRREEARTRREGETGLLGGEEEENGHRKEGRERRHRFQSPSTQQFQFL